MDIKLLFGEAVREYRHKRNISQEKLAELCEVHRTYISDIERGERNVSLSTIQKICLGLKIKMSELFMFIEKDLKK